MNSKIIAVAIALALSFSVNAQVDEHSDHTLEVSRVLPAELIKGPHHEVVDPVVNFFALDQFKIKSDYGEFDSYGQLMLRIQLREIEAISVLEQQTKASVAKQTVLREGKKTVQSVAEVAKHPILAIKGIGAGLKNRFRKMGRNIKEDIATARSGASAADKANAYAGRWLGVDKAKRRWAGELLIDPYTTNTVLAAQLTRVAEFEAGAELGTKWLLPSIPGAGFMRDVFKLVTELDFRQLIEYNTKTMMELGASEEAVEAFLSHPSYSPTAVSTLIAGIGALDGVENRMVLASQAVTAQSTVEGLFFLESVAMAYWYHENVAPLKRMVLETGLPAAITEDGNVVVFAAVDFPHWSTELEEIMQEMDSAYKEVSPDRELILAGNASRTFKAHMQELDWTLRIGVRDYYLDMLPWAITNGDMAKR
jgi:hypothetical protein